MNGAEDRVFSEQIQALVEQQKPFLNPRLTLERFSELLQLPPRQVSTIINRQFHQNFQEYVNRHRVEEAKRLLSTPDSAELSILEIAQLAGFNSKATFNRIFKNIATMTPSCYKQQFKLKLANEYVEHHPQASTHP